jgi:hypothetical protein
MSYSIAEMRELDDERLIREHDEIAVHTVVGTQWYEDELSRRDQARVTAATVRLSVVTVRLAWASTGLSAIAVIAAVIALFKG